MDYIKDDRFDPLYGQIAQQCGGVLPLLQTFLGFMRRKTDFFYVPPNEEKAKEAGFPAGVAEKMLLSCFREQANLPNPFQTRDEKERKTADKNKAAERTSKEAAPHSESENKGKMSIQDNKSATSTAAATANSSKTESETSAKAVPVSSCPWKVPEEQRQKALSTVSTYNGSRTSTFAWSQTLHDVSISLPFKGDTTAKSIAVDLTSQGVTVSEKGGSRGSDRLQFQWFDRVIEDESTWSLEECRGTKLLVITLEKKREIWWETAFANVGDGKIDTTNVDSTRPIDDYDEATQAAIRKAAFDMRQQRLGQKTSAEIEREEALRKAWDAEGSPFKGTPYDPSLVQFSDSQPPPSSDGEM